MDEEWEAGTLSLTEITTLMCAVAAENTWKRGKRDFMITTRDMFGIVLTVRHKQHHLAMTSDSWRISLQMVRAMDKKTREKAKPFATVNIPYMTIQTSRGANGEYIKHEPITVFGEIPITAPVFDIQNMEKFERDWTLLRLFSSEWSHYGP
jgi:hypothetical protein